MQLMKEQKQLATTMSTDEEVMNKKFDASQTCKWITLTIEQKMETKEGDNKRKDQNNERRDPNLSDKVEGEWKKRG